MKEFDDTHFPAYLGANVRECVYLYPGDFHFATVPTMIYTVLGSCVSVTLFDRRSKFGAMCHAVLDSDPLKKDVSRCAKYMDCILDQMFSMFAEYRISASNVEVKMFGGAQMFVHGAGAPAGYPPGKKNILMAKKILREYDCCISAEDCGGLQGRKVYFCSHTGDVFLKRIKKVEGP